MYDDEGYYVILPDPDVLPEPGYEDLCWVDILNQIYHESLYMQEYQDWVNSEQGWFRY